MGLLVSSFVSTRVVVFLQPHKILRFSKGDKKMNGKSGRAFRSTMLDRRAAQEKEEEVVWAELVDAGKTCSAWNRCLAQHHPRFLKWLCAYSPREYSKLLSEHPGIPSLEECVINATPKLVEKSDSVRGVWDLHHRRGATVGGGKNSRGNGRRHRTHNLSQ